MSPRSTPDLATAEGVRGYLEAAGVGVARVVPYDGRDRIDQKLILASCPFSDAHDDGAYVLRYLDGGVHAGCRHASCSGKGWADLRAIVEPGWEPGAGGGAEGPRGRGGGPRAADAVVGCADGLDVFHGKDGRPYAFDPAEPGVGAFLIGGTTFDRMIRRRYFLREGSTPPAQAVSDAVLQLTGRALFDGPERDVRIRTGRDGGAVVVNLADAEGRVVVVTPGGWRVEPASGVAFRVPKSALPLPVPARSETAGASLGLLRRHLRLTDEDFVLVLGWLVQALLPEGPYPLLFLEGEQGTGKSVASRMIRGLVDPARPTTRSMPGAERDLVIAAENNHALAFDNLSGMRPDLSDALCRISTGGGFATRELYSGREEEVFDVVRPVIANGIDQIAGRADLADRAIRVELQPIPTSERRPEAELFAAYEADRPAILGGVLDAVSSSLRPLESRPQGLPRMADFALTAAAASRVFPVGLPAFGDAYETNRRRHADDAVRGDAFASGVLALLEAVEGAEVTMTMGEMLDGVRKTLSDPYRPPKGFPTTAQGAAHAWKRAAPVLRQRGVTREELPRSGASGTRNYRWRLEAGGPDPSQTADRPSAGGEVAGEAPPGTPAP